MLADDFFSFANSLFHFRLVLQQNAFPCILSLSHAFLQSWRQLDCIKRRLDLLFYAQEKKKDLKATSATGEREMVRERETGRRKVIERDAGESETKDE